MHLHKKCGRCNLSTLCEYVQTAYLQTKLMHTFSQGIRSLLQDVDLRRSVHALTRECLCTGCTCWRF